MLATAEAKPRDVTSAGAAPSALLPLLPPRMAADLLTKLRLSAVEVEAAICAFASAEPVCVEDPFGGAVVGTLSVEAIAPTVDVIAPGLGAAGVAGNVTGVDVLFISLLICVPLTRADTVTRTGTVGMPAGPLVEAPSFGAAVFTWTVALVPAAVAFADALASTVGFLAAFVGGAVVAVVFTLVSTEVFPTDVLADALTVTDGAVGFFAAVVLPDALAFACFVVTVTLAPDELG